jgi:excisionase family DNA binding protein
MEAEMGSEKGMVMTEKFFYSRKEVASSLAICVRKVDYLISERKLRTRRIGRRVVIPTEDVKRVAAEIMRSDMLGAA